MELVQKGRSKGKSDRDCMEFLLESLGSPNEYVHWRITEDFLESNYQKSVNSFLCALQDEDHWTRETAVKALCQLNDPRAVEPLFQTLKDDDEGVRWAAATALGHFRDARAVGPLIQALKDRDWYVRRAVIQALVNIGVLAVEPLLHVLEKSNADVRRLAAEILAKINDSRAVVPIISNLQDKDHSVRQAAAEALGVLKISQAIDPLLLALKDESERVRRAAVRALGKLGDPRVVGSLLRVLNDNDRRVRLIAMLVLDKLAATDKQVVVVPLVNYLAQEGAFFSDERLTDVLNWLIKFLPLTEDFISLQPLLLSLLFTSSEKTILQQLAKQILRQIS